MGGILDIATGDSHMTIRAKYRALARIYLK